MGGVGSECGPDVLFSKTVTPCLVPQDWHQCGGSPVLGGQLPAPRRTGEGTPLLPAGVGGLPGEVRPRASAEDLAAFRLPHLVRGERARALQTA